MGFHTTRAVAPEPGFLLIVSGAPDAVRNAGDITDAGGILVRSDDAAITSAEMKKIVEAIPDTPTGLYMEETDAKSVEAALEAGADFLVFPASSRVFAAPDEKGPGRILQVESSMDDSLLRAVNSLPVDAVMVTDSFTGGALAWHELMIFQHLANMFAKPLIVNLPADTTADELKALWEAGVDGVVVDAAAMKAGGIRELQKNIAKLPPRSARKQGKRDVTLGRAGNGESHQPPPDEEEEEEDE
jgi:hypothetical protein